MPRCELLIALLLAGAAAVAAETVPAPAVRTAKEPMPGPKPTTASGRKPVEQKAGESPSNPRDTQKPSLPLLEEKNLGLGCAQN